MRNYLCSQYRTCLGQAAKTNELRLHCTSCPESDSDGIDMTPAECYWELLGEIFRHRVIKQRKTRQKKSLFVTYGYGKEKSPARTAARWPRSGPAAANAR